MTTKFNLKSAAIGFGVACALFLLPTERVDIPALPEPSPNFRYASPSSPLEVPGIVITTIASAVQDRVEFALALQRGYEKYGP